MTHRSYLIFCLFIGLSVVLLGAYTRLTHSGLGCPDWPGCYGQLTVPETPEALAQAKAQFPTETIEPAKAWPEMIHRYLAGSFALLLVGLIIYGWIKAPQQKRWPYSLLALILVFQALLGKWTVTWKLHPMAVMPHLLGGMTLVVLLWVLFLNQSNGAKVATTRSQHNWLLALTILTVGQIFIGGWTSSNYAALICPDFPFCQGQWLPQMDFQSGFNFTLPIGANYEGGLLSTSARTAIHVTHRFLALIILCVSVPLFTIYYQRLTAIRKPLLISAGLLTIQIILGIINVVHQLPLSVATLHNGTALLFLLSLVNLISRCAPCPRS